MAADIETDDKYVAADIRSSSDAPKPHCGNLVLYKGSHKTHADYFRKNGTDHLLGMYGQEEWEMPVALPDNDPEPQLVSAGDVVIAHFLTAHGISANLSPHIRYALYFRVTSSNFDTSLAYTDLWRNWKV